MEEFVGWLLGFAAIATAVVFAVWIAVALLARVLSLLMVYWGITFLGSLLVGVIVGAILPVRVLGGKGRAELWQITPADLVDGRVIKRKPRSPNAEYGWDSAWPNYVPYQANQDARAVRLEAHGHVGMFWAWLRSKTRGKAKGEGEKKTGFGRFFSSLGTGIPAFALVLSVFPAFVGYLIGVWGSTLSWLLIMVVLRNLVALLQWIGLSLYALFDVGDRRRLRATIKCPQPHCYGVSSLPGYRCSNPECNVVHWTMLPGPLGLFTRRCSCGTRLPNTVSSAAKTLTPICPYCREELAGGSGARQTVQVALIGSIGAGKTRLLDAMIVDLADVLVEVGGVMTPLNDDAEQYFGQAIGRRTQSAPTTKTRHESPLGLPFLITKDNRTVELQVMDAAGEAFTSWDETAKLRYLDTADGIVLVLDPLALPEVRDHLRRSKFANSILLAGGDQEEAYAAAIDRLRAESVPLDKRGLAVVLTKGDILMNLPVAASLDPSDSASIRAWLIQTGADLMARRFEKDFREVRYFVVDSMRKSDVRSPLNPWWVADWLLNEARSPLRLGQRLTVPEAAAPPSKQPVTSGERS